MADVTYQRDDYIEYSHDWRMVEDVCAGERAVKDAGVRYLPKPNPDDESEANRKRYEQYKARAVFYNATGRTLQGLTGAAFRRTPSLSVPPRLDYAAADVDGSGIGIYQQSQSVLAGVLKTGRRGLLVDYPQVDGQTSRAQQLSGQIRASIIDVNTDQIINWRSERVGGVNLLSLVVIRETYQEVTSDGFGFDNKTQYRVLRLQGGQYTVEIWRAGAGSGWAIYDSYVPLDGAGNPWQFIPFTFVGAENNDPRIDKSPLLDLAQINLAHYRNSADYEDSVFFTGQAQPWISGLSEQWRDHMEQSGIYIGSRAPILLPEGGAFGFAQAQPNTLAKEAMDQKEAQMVALGARLIERGSAVKTATEAQADNEAEHSVLSLAAENVSDAYTMALQWAARFENVADTNIEYRINNDFVEHTLDAQMLTALVQAWQSGQFPSVDLWAQFRKYGLIDPEKTDEQIRDELESESVGLVLDNVEVE